mmetsp:Transcript_68815/g.211005  ORF Transcript_68815/g.211005 Transcript_68815/m.211005 type:complete len:203 (-) Transcript_68815:38-646(-)
MESWSSRSQPAWCTFTAASTRVRVWPSWRRMVHWYTKPCEPMPMSPRTDSTSGCACKTCSSVCGVFGGFSIAPGASSSLSSAKSESMSKRWRSTIPKRWRSEAEHAPKPPLRGGRTFWPGGPAVSGPSRENPARGAARRNPAPPRSSKVSCPPSALELPLEPPPLGGCRPQLIGGDCGAKPAPSKRLRSIVEPAPKPPLKGG